MTEPYRLLIRRTGGPNVIESEPIAHLTPGPGEVLVRNSAIGVNFIDTYHRSGLYPLPLPSGLGSEAAGYVEAVGPGVAIEPGVRVGVLASPPGSYATHRVVQAVEIIPLPDAVDDETAAAILLKGLTAWMLAEPCGKVKAGDWVLVHAAAGGVGSLLVPWLRSLGARVIAHAGTGEKAATALAAGAEIALSGDFGLLGGAVKDATDGRGVATVFDGVGAASFDASLGCLAPRGLMISYGNASGAVPPMAPARLAQGGSLFLTRPVLWNYTGEPEIRASGVARLFELLSRGVIQPNIRQRYPLREAAAAHRALEARKTTGATILRP